MRMRLNATRRVHVELLLDVGDYVVTSEAKGVRWARRYRKRLVRAPDSGEVAEINAQLRPAAEAETARREAKKQEFIAAHAGESNATTIKITGEEMAASEAMAQRHAKKMTTPPRK